MWRRYHLRLAHLAAAFSPVTSTKVPKGRSCGFRGTGRAWSTEGPRISIAVRRDVRRRGFIPCRRAASLRVDSVAVGRSLAGRRRMGKATRVSLPPSGSFAPGSAAAPSRSHHRRPPPRTAGGRLVFGRNRHPPSRPPVGCVRQRTIILRRMIRSCVMGRNCRRVVTLKPEASVAAKRKRQRSVAAPIAT
jgi:hypothetical protein